MEEKANENTSSRCLAIQREHQIVKAMIWFLQETPRCLVMGMVGGTSGTSTKLSKSRLPSLAADGVGTTTAQSRGSRPGFRYFSLIFQAGTALKGTSRCTTCGCLGPARRTGLRTACSERFRCVEALETIPTLSPVSLILNPRSADRRSIPHRSGVSAASAAAISSFASTT